MTCTTFQPCKTNDDDGGDPPYTVCKTERTLVFNFASFSFRPNPTTRFSFNPRSPSRPKQAGKGSPDPARSTRSPVHTHKTFHLAIPAANYRRWIGATFLLPFHSTPRQPFDGILSRCVDLTMAMPYRESCVLRRCKATVWLECKTDLPDNPILLICVDLLKAHPVVGARLVGWFGALGLVFSYAAGLCKMVHPHTHTQHSALKAAR